MSSESLYTTLGLAEDATQEQIRASYLRLLQQYHPDKCTDENATLKTQQLVAAYTVLSDVDKRHIYDGDHEAEFDMPWECYDSEDEDSDNSFFMMQDFFLRQFYEYLFRQQDYEDVSSDSFGRQFRSYCVVNSQEADWDAYRPNVPSEKQQRDMGRAPNMLSRPKVRVLSDASLLIDWTMKKAARTPIDLFEVRFKLNKGWKILYKGQKTKVKVSDLKPNSLYEFQVRGLNNVGDGPWSAVASKRTPCTKLGVSEREGARENKRNHQENGQNMSGKTTDQADVSPQQFPRQASNKGSKEQLKTDSKARSGQLDPKERELRKKIRQIQAFTSLYQRDQKPDETLAEKTFRSLKAQWKAMGEPQFVAGTNVKKVIEAYGSAVQLKEEMTLVQCQLKALAKTAKVEDVDELSNTIDRALELGLSHAAEHAVAVLVKLKQQTEIQSKLMEAREARNIQMLQEAIFEAEVASIKHRAAKKLLYQLEAEAQYKLQAKRAMNSRDPMQCLALLEDIRAHSHHLSDTALADVQEELERIVQQGSGGTVDATTKSETALHVEDVEQLLYHALYREPPDKNALEEAVRSWEESGASDPFLSGLMVECKTKLDSLEAEESFMMRFGIA